MHKVLRASRRARAEADLLVDVPNAIIRTGPAEIRSKLHRDDAVAEREIKAFDDNTKISTSMPTRSAAEAWLRRVQTWKANLRQDLEADSLPAPGPLTSTDKVFIPYSRAFEAAASAAI